MNVELRIRNQSLIGQLKDNQNILKSISVEQLKTQKPTAAVKQELLRKKGIPQSANQNSLRSSTPKDLAKSNFSDNEALDDTFLRKLQNSGNIRVPVKLQLNDPLKTIRPHQDCVTIKSAKPVYPSGKSNLLGYDWICEILDLSDTACDNKSDAYFSDLQSFRNSYSPECFAGNDSNAEQQFGQEFLSAMPHLPSYESKPPLPVTEHQCVHLFRMNARGFAVPVNVNDSGESICPVCKKMREKDFKTLIRVTVPKSLLPGFNPVTEKTALYHSYPNSSENEYSPGDSVGLSRHIVNGWRSARPKCVLPATFVDIKSESTK
ncbi:uncharacterized protein LOC134851145 [Symsagittifera roscoffensis]|uniref:uncharacterized protein LOC134851145 n=1 Tax=Symsagittifera roscoffensis TaxID=84072 RepID=UPI00307C1AAF